MTEEEFDELIEHYAGINVNIALSSFSDKKSKYTYDDLENVKKQILEVYRRLND